MVPTQWEVTARPVPTQLGVADRRFSLSFAGLLGQFHLLRRQGLGGGRLALAPQRPAQFLAFRTLHIRQALAVGAV